MDCSVNFLKTGGEVPSPRFLSAGVLVSNVLLIWGGATKLDDKFRAIGPYDNSLYLLSLVSREWTRIPVNGPGPVGRFGHTMTMVGSKLFVFGGKTDEKCLNDMWALNLNTLNSKLGWDSYEPPSGDEKPPPRSQHVAVSTSDRIILFGGTHDRKCYNDTWVFDISTRKWTELQCTGPIPSPRCSHAAALVDDVMYVFGGRDAERRHLGDLIAFKLSTRQWFMLRNMGNPRGRLGHAMVSNETRVFVLGGKLARGHRRMNLHSFTFSRQNVSRTRNRTPVASSLVRRQPNPR
ncbi:galactose oxidase [Russula vinacea]|nr:galactose oxidase [Russula vinacea]